MTTEIVPLTAENIVAFSRLYASVFNAEPWNDGWTEQAVDERFRTFVQYPKFRGLGHFSNGEAVALVFGWGERWVRGWHFHIKEMCVATQLQGEQAGTQLLTAFERELAAEGYDRVFLQTGEAVRARKFYEKLGYKPISLVSLAKSIEA